MKQGSGLYLACLTLVTNMVDESSKIDNECKSVEVYMNNPEIYFQFLSCNGMY